MNDPTAKDCLTFLAMAARRVLVLDQSDQYNKAVAVLGALIDADDARKAIDADKAKQAEKAA